MPLISIFWLAGIVSTGVAGYFLLDKAGDTAVKVTQPIQDTSNSLMSLALVGIAVFLVYETVIKKSR